MDQPTFISKKYCVREKGGGRRMEFDLAKYEHSPVHAAIISKDHDHLRKITSQLPRFCNSYQVQTESDSLAEDAKADAIAAVLDRRDVPDADTPLHLAVKCSDHLSFQILLHAGADYSLKNASGWNPLEEALSKGEDSMARTILRHKESFARAKWFRRLPRLVATMRRMRDFYMEINFHVESSAIPFVSKFAPSDTYRIWKKGANLRTDWTLDIFEGICSRRSSKSYRFLGDGVEGGKAHRGTLCLVSHKRKEIAYGLEGSDSATSEAEIQHLMTDPSLFRASVSVKEAVLSPQKTWRGKEKTETVGSWKAKVYDMHNVVITCKSRDIYDVRAPKIDMYDKIAPTFRKEEKREREIVDEEFKEKLRPSLWLSLDFPLRIEELLPLFDILATRVTMIRRFKEYITTQLPQGTFPVKVSIPIVATMKLVVTFTKFEELKPCDEVTRSSKSHRVKSTSSKQGDQDLDDPFAFPSDYTWIRRGKEKQSMFCR